MKKLSTLLLLLACGCMLHVNAQVADLAKSADPKSRIMKAYFSQRSQLKQALPLCETNGVEMFPDEGYMVFEGDAAFKQELESMGFHVVYDDHYDIHRNRSEIIENAAGIPGYPCYKTVEEAFAIMDDFVKQYPNMAEVIDIGDSWEKVNGLGGYDIRVLKLTNKKITGNKPKLFIEGSIHAREYTTAELVIRATQHLMNNYGKDADATWMLDHHELYALYYVNPDGRKQAEAGKSWRKNTNRNYCGATSNMRGCDLNRNFDQNWSKTGTNDPCANDYYGPSAASEPEVKAIQDYVSKLFENSKGVYIDFHSYGEVIYYIRSTGQKNLCGRFEFFNDYNKPEMIEGGQTYEWGYYHSNASSYLFELGTAFFQNCNFFETNVLPKNLPAIIYALRVARDPEVISAGPDALNLSLDQSLKLRAMIDDTRYSTQSAQATHTITDAEYYIDVPPWLTGAKAYKMTAADGAYNATAESVEATINLQGITPGKHIVYVRGKDANNVWGPVSAVFFNNGTTHIAEPEEDPVYIYPNPVRDIITIESKDRIERIDIYNTFGQLIAADEIKLMPAGSALKADLSHLPDGMYFLKLTGEESSRSVRFVKN